jgi:anti-sigma28 factor (negative regulator of flagellin synthesis)
MLRLNRALWAQSASSEAPAAYLVLAFRYSQTAGNPENDPFRRWPRERTTMYIYGTNQIHAAQPISPPHRMTPTQGAGNVSSFRGVDQLDISPEADFVAQARELPEIREDRVAALKAQIQSGTYETADKLDMALSNLLDEIA